MIANVMKLLLEQKQKVNIIFLDIDGVLTTLNTKYYYLDPVCMGHLKKVVDATNAYFVISSTWRLYHMDRLMPMLADCGLEDRVIGVTPSRKETKDIGNDKKLILAWGRGFEIDEWLKNNEAVVDKYAVFDDDKHDLRTHVKVHVHTDTCKGLNAEDAEKAIEILK